MTAKSDLKNNLDLEDDFPAKGSAEDKLNFLMQYAVLSPAIRGAKPWKFSVEGDAVNLCLDRSRARRPTDPDIRELTLICGVALEHLHVAARQFGLKLKIETFPSEDPNLLATIRLNGRQTPSETDTVMFYAIHKWQGERRPLRAGRKVPVDLLTELQTLADTDKIWLHLARDKQERSELASLVVVGELAEKEAVKMSGKSTVPSATRKRNSDSSGITDGFDAVARYVLSFLPKVSADKASAQRKKLLAETEPVLAVLGTDENNRESWLAAGRTLAIVLLRSLAIGVRASLVNQPVQNPELSRLLCSVLDRSGHPQMMFRLGYPESSAKGNPKTNNAVREELL